MQRLDKVVEERETALRLLQTGRSMPGLLTGGGICLEKVVGKGEDKELVLMK